MDGWMDIFALWSVGHSALLNVWQTWGDSCSEKFGFRLDVISSTYMLAGFLWFGCISKFFIKTIVIKISLKDDIEHFVPFFIRPTQCEVRSLGCHVCHSLQGFFWKPCWRPCVLFTRRLCFVCLSPLGKASIKKKRFLSGIARIT